jgi:hypothetical protein
VAWVEAAAARAAARAAAPAAEWAGAVVAAAAAVDRSVADHRAAPADLDLAVPADRAALVDPVARAATAKHSRTLFADLETGRPNGPPFFTSSSA